MNVSFKTAWDHFERVARGRTATGVRRLVPVVGSGLNVAATGDPDSWPVLLDAVRRQVGLPRHPGFTARLSGHSMTALWEWFVSTLAFTEQRPAHAVEDELRKAVRQQLRVFEENSRAHPWYRRFLACGFGDVVSLNFDRTLALSSTDRHRVIRAGRPDGGAGREASLFRHAVVAQGASRTRVWYPHGDTQSYPTIKLGVRDYGVYIGALNRAFQSYKQRERAFLEGRPPVGSSPDASRRWSDAVRRQEPLTWLWVLLGAPLVFVGCGMTRDEWPLWWALHQRARNQARHAAADREPVFVLWNVGVGDPNHQAMTEWLRTSPAGVRLLPCYDWEEGWERFFAAFEG